MNDPINIPISDAAQSIELTVNLRGLKMFKLRLYVLKTIFWLATVVSPVPLVIQD